MSHGEPADRTLMSQRDPLPAPRRPDAPPPSLWPPSGRPELVSGCVLGGRYRVDKSVGRGGMGEVWAAEHVTIHTRVAVKVLLGHALCVPETVARFEREAVLLGRMNGDQVPRVFDFLVDPLYGPVLVTEFVEGESLADVLKAPMSVEQALDLGIDLATALAEIHRAGVVHRDLKPGNVILRPRPTGKSQAVVIDLGISRLVRDRTADIHEQVAVTTGDAVVGTIEYMAPEQIVSCGDVTAAADLYALGALLFRAVTGRAVFGSVPDKLELVRTKLTQDAPRLPTGRRDPVANGLTKVLACALERNPIARYQSAEDLRADLFHLRDLMVQRPAPSGFDAATRRGTRSLAPHGRGVVRRIVVSAAFVVALLLGAVWSQIGHSAPNVATAHAPE